MRGLKYFCVLVLIFLSGFLCLSLSTPARADELFDSYGKISWADEKAHLDNFGLFLQRNPEMLGYIAFCSTSSKESRSNASRIDRGKRYLISDLKIQGNRIVVVKGGLCEFSKTILQPIAKGIKPAKFF